MLAHNAAFATLATGMWQALVSGCVLYDRTYVYDTYCDPPPPAAPARESQRCGATSYEYRNSYCAVHHVRMYVQAIEEAGRGHGVLPALLRSETLQTQKKYEYRCLSEF